MAQGVVKPSISFEVLIKSVVELRPEDKRRLWELLNKEIAQSEAQFEEEMWEQRRQQLTAAAEALLPDYAAGGELTVFTALNSEGFQTQG